MKINELIESAPARELLVNKARELIVELLAEVLKIMPKTKNVNENIRFEINSSIEFLTTIITKSILKYPRNSGPDAEFIHSTGTQLLQHIKTKRNSLK